MADASGQFAVPSPMSFSGNIAQNWKLWFQKFTIYMLATKKDNLNQKVKTSMLLNCIGEEGLRIFDTFSFLDHNDVEKYDLVVQKFKDYCEPQKNISYDRFKFYNCVQKPEQTFDQFLTELLRLASSCEFADLDEMIRDRVVMGIGDSSVQERLMRESNLTLKKAIYLCRVAEIEKIQHQEMDDKSVVLAIKAEVKKPQKWTKFPKRQERCKPSKQESTNGQINEKVGCIILDKLTRPSTMFSNRQQQNSSNLLHQNISSSGPIVLPPPPPAIAIPTMVSSNSSAVTSVATTILALDGLNCGGIPTRTTPTLTPTTLRTIAADIANLSPGPSENFAAAASDLHHLVSSSCSTMSTSTLGASDRTDLQERVNIHNLSNQTISLQSINNQQISLNNLQNHQNVNQNTLNQQQRNDYNNSFSTAASRQAGFVPPLVLQINSTNPIAQQSSGSTILLNNNTSSGSSSIFSAKGSSTSASSSHWQGVVVTQRPQNRARSITKRQFTDDEDGDDDYDSAADDGTDSSDTTSSKMTRKQNNKNNKSSSKNGNKNELKNSSGGSRRTNNKDNKMMSAEEEQRRQVRRERNKLAAARCRKRRMDHTNELLEETGQLEDKRLRLQVEIQGLRQQKTDLQQMLAQHKCAVNMNNVQLSNSVATVNHATTILDSNEISETKPIILSNHLSSIKGSPLQQNISTNAVINDNDSNNVDDIIIKHEDNSIIQTDIDSKDSINIIPTTVMQQPHRRRPTTLLQLNNGNFGNSKKISGNGSTGVVVLNFDSLMDGGTGLTPVSSSGGSVQNHHQQVQHNSTGNGGVNTENNSVLS